MRKETNRAVQLPLFLAECAIEWKPAQRADVLMLLAELLLSGVDGADMAGERDATEAGDDAE